MGVCSLVVVDTTLQNFPFLCEVYAVFRDMKQTTTVMATGAVLIGVFPMAAIAATFNLEEATVADINAAFDAGALTSERLTQLYLNRIDAYDDSGPNINAIRTLNPNALETAAALDQERESTGPRSPLHGIPILLKDNYDTFDLPTTGGSDALAGSIPPDDAFVVEQFRDAGAVILGKAEMDEFAISGSGYSSLGGFTLNPYQLNRQSGGSSSGTGAAIAANFATVGTGSDTGGSIRTPSSFQSLVGVRPTRGLVSLDGIIPYTLSRDMVGPMARTVTDAAVTLGVMAEFDPNNPSTSTLIPPPTVQPDKFYTDYTQFLDRDDLKGARLGVVRNYFGIENGVDPEVTRLTEAALEKMRKLGASTVDITFNNSFLSTMASTYDTAASAEQEAYLEAYLATLGPEYPKTVEEVIAILESPEVANSETASTIIDSLRDTLESEGLDNPDYIDVAENLTPFVRNTLLKTLNSKDLDAFVFPTVRTVARPLSGTEDPTFVDPEGSPDARQVEFASSTGLADVTVPAGFNSDGLPVTISLTGRPYSEPTLLGLAYSYEQATMLRRPPTTTPPLRGEVFKYEPVPEPDTIPALTLFGLTALGLKLKQRRKIHKRGSQIT